MLSFNSLIQLFIPRVCPGCQKVLYRSEKILCFSCQHLLPRTNYHFYPKNPIEQLFWGRFQVNAASAFLLFQKKGKVQQVLHHLKYKGFQQLGYELGFMYGLELKGNSSFNRAELIIPVPLHPRKRRVRGYNQSEVFAEGLSASMGIRISANNLVRADNSSSQTKKNRYSRWENVERAFYLKSPELLSGKKVLLVDDVITTGSTLEACAVQLRKSGVSEITIACIAFAAKH